MYSNSVTPRVQYKLEGKELESLLFWLLCVATQILNLCTLLYFHKEYGYDFCAQSNVKHQRQSNSLHVDKANSVSDEAIPFTLLQCHALQWSININADLMSVLTWVPPAVCRIPCNLLLW